MGLLGWLLFGALALGAVILISEVVSYFITGSSLLGWLREKKAGNQLKGFGRFIVKGNDGHKVTLQALEDGCEKDTVELSSTSGTSSEIKINQIFDI